VKPIRIILKQTFAITLFACISSNSIAFDYWQSLPDKPIIPKNNPQDAKKILLGKKIFFDKRISKNKNTSCNDCHNLTSGGDDNGKLTKNPSNPRQRSAPSLWNVAYMSTYYWDSRAKSLEQQFHMHLFNDGILGKYSETELIQKISDLPGYDQLFAETFNDKKINSTNISKALANFIRTLIVADSRADQYIKGNKLALNEKEERGYFAFQEQGCLSCHFGVNFAGPAPGPALKMGDGFYELFPTIRGTEYEDEKYGFLIDKGRFHFTKEVDHKLMWRVPSLRNIADSSPYFHNGKIESLHDAVRIMNRVQFNYPINEETIDDIVAFLKTLSGQYPKINQPNYE